jgi:hypothetical protein
MILDPSKNHFDGPVAVPIYGEPDEDGLAPVVGFRAGYHVNATAAGMAAADLSAFVIEPATPSQVYAGAATVFLFFDDEAAALAAIPSQFWAD